MRLSVLALALLSICQTPTIAASTIDTLAAQMSQAADNARDEEGLAIAQKLEALVKRQQGTDNMNYAGALHNEGMFLNNLGRFEEAADRLSAALAIKLHNNDAASIIRTSNILVNALMILQRRDEAASVGKQALTIGTQAFGPDDPRLADAIEAMGLVASEQENYKDAEGYFQRSLAIKQKTPNIMPFELALAMDYLGDLYGLEGRFDDGERLLRQSLKILEQSYGADAPRAPNYSKILNDLGNLYKDAGRLPEAEAALRKAIATERTKAGAGDQNAASTIGNLALVLNAQSRYAEAETLFNQTLIANEKAYGPKSSGGRLCVEQSRQQLRRSGPHCRGCGDAAARAGHQRKGRGPRQPRCCPGFVEFGQQLQGTGASGGSGSTLRASASDFFAEIR